MEKKELKSPCTPKELFTYLKGKGISIRLKMDNLEVAIPVSTPKLELCIAIANPSIRNIEFKREKTNITIFKFNI